MYFEYFFTIGIIASEQASCQDKHNNCVFECFYQSSLSISDSYLLLPLLAA